MRRITIAGREFSSRTAAKACAKGILDKYNVGDCIDEGEQAFLAAAIALRGPEKLQEKTGPGIKNIFIGYSGSGIKAFFIRRIDGSETDFSYIKCFKEKHSHFSDFAQACRNAIKDDKAALKIGLGYAKYDVHHDDVAFKNIVQTFIESNQIDIQGVTYHTGDNVEGRYFRDESLIASFREHHSRLASLQVLSKGDHKKKHKRKN